MKINARKECNLIEEAIELFSVAVNLSETERRQYLANFRKFERELADRMDFQKLFFRLADELTLTPSARYYFEAFKEESDACLARCLISTFFRGETENVEEMKAFVLAKFRKYDLEDFPLFDEDLRRGFSFGEGRRRFLNSVRDLEIDDKYKARLIFAFEDFENALDELGNLIGEAAALLMPYKEQMDREAERIAMRWNKYFEEHSMEEFFQLTGVLVDEGQYEEMNLIPRLVIGGYLSLSIGEEDSDRTLTAEIGSFMEEKIIKGWGFRGDREALQMLADPVKLDILLYIKNDAHFGKEIAERFSLTTATISYHMNELLNQGLIKVRQQGKRIYYSLDRERVQLLLEQVKEMFE